MPGPYGVTAAGFNPKTLAEQLAEIEIEEKAVFGAGIQFGAQTPLGQLNGVYADASAEMWEVAQDIYQSVDIDQATGARLDSLGKLQRVARIPGQTDSDYRLAISQSGYGSTKTRRIRQKILALDGVTQVQVTENPSKTQAQNGLGPHSLAISVVGGNDEEIALTIWENTVGGIGLFGNTQVQIDSDGYCTVVSFIRPTEVPLCLEIELSIHIDQCSCAPTDIQTIISNLTTWINGDCGVTGGSLLTPARIEQQLALNSGVYVEAIRMARDGETPEYQNVGFLLGEIPVLDPECLSVTYVTHDGPGQTQGSVGYGLIQGVIA